MKKENSILIIRRIYDREYKAVGNFVHNAYKTADVCGGNERERVQELREKKEYLSDMELILESSKRIFGHIIVTELPMPSREKAHSLYIGSIAIDNDLRNKGQCTELIRSIFKKAERYGYDSVFLVGDPKYFTKLGFKQATEFGLKNTNGYEDKYVLCKELKEGSVQGEESEFTLL